MVTVLGKCCSQSKLPSRKLKVLVLCVATVLTLCVLAQLHLLKEYVHLPLFAESNSGALKKANGLLRTNNQLQGSWKKGNFCHDFVLDTFHTPLPVCETDSEISESDQVKCYISAYTKYLAMCSYENLAMQPRHMVSVIPTDSQWKKPRNRTINLLRYDNPKSLCENSSVHYLESRTSPKNFEPKLTRHLLESEKLSPNVCDTWINKTTFLHISNSYHIYFRFLDLYNLHRAILDYNVQSTGQLQVLRIGNIQRDYMFPEFDKALFPGALSLEDIQDWGTVCFKKAILVPRSYQSVSFQCKMNRKLMKRCFECDGKGLKGSPFHTFRTRVLRACNITQAHNASQNPHLVIVSRQAYKHWPGFNSSTSFKRVLSNEAEMVDGIKDAFPHVRVDVVHMENLDICEQVRYAVKADVLLGVHGAGLVHLWWLREEAAVFELEPAFQASNPSFRMLATLTGRNYVSELIGGVATEVTVNVDQLISSLKSFL